MANQHTNPVDEQAVRQALADSNGVVRAAVKLLAERGRLVCRKTVQNIYHKLATSGDVAKAASSGAKISLLSAKIADLTRQLGSALEFNEGLSAAISAIEPLPPFKISTPPAVKRDTPVDAMLLCSDWHGGEVTNAAEMEGMNEYNYDIMCRRLSFLGTKFIHWLKTERQGHNIQNLHIAMLGDLLSGDIHDELKRTNEWPVPVAIVKVAQAAAALIQSLAPHFPAITIHQIGADNHGRLERKPYAKQRATNNFQHPLFHLLNAYLHDHKNVSSVIYPGTKAQFDVRGRSILAEHGHAVKAWMGIPYYGMERLEGREARQRLRFGRPYQMHLWGHWHCPLIGPFGIVNGSLSGTDEFDHEAGRYADPSQVSVLVHPRYGWYNAVAWNLKDVP